MDMEKKQSRDDIYKGNILSEKQRGNLLIWSIGAVS